MDRWGVGGPHGVMMSELLQEAQGDRAIEGVVNKGRWDRDGER